MTIAATALAWVVLGAAHQPQVASGLAIGESTPAFHPLVVSGLDAGKAGCPI